MRLAMPAAGRCLACLLLSPVRRASAWGSDGHSIIASVAARLLNKAATERVGSLLASEGGGGVEAKMAGIASWADEVLSHDRDRYGWSTGLHFLNVQDGACWEYGSVEGPQGCKYDHERDCKDDYCNIGAIKNYTGQLRSGDGDLNAALKFVVHFTGDIHQPLHCGLAKDRGGVNINVKFHVNDQGDDWNLHKVWDFGMIVDKEGTENHYAKMVDALEALGKGDFASKVSLWTADTDPTYWAVESLGQATKYAYRYPNGTAIAWHEDDHETFVLPMEEYQSTLMKDGGVVDEQLLKGAVRLAATLNSIWPDPEDGFVVMV